MTCLPDRREPETHRHGLTVNAITSANAHQSVRICVKRQAFRDSYRLRT